MGILYVLWLQLVHTNDKMSYTCKNYLCCNVIINLRLKLEGRYNKDVPKKMLLNQLATPRRLPFTLFLLCLCVTLFSVVIKDNIWTNQSVAIFPKSAIYTKHFIRVKITKEIALLKCAKHYQNKIYIKITFSCMT